MAKEYGYVRVSSTDQNEDRQMNALQEKGILNKNIYMDKVSGKDFMKSRLRMHGSCGREMAAVPYFFKTGGNI